ncbi:hypothetical protein ACTFIY_007126 [Dictyostelium cf. discoideum]
MDKPKIIINSHSKEEQFKLILDTGSNVSLINKRLISKEIKNHVHKTKAKINFPLLDVKEEFVEQINIQVKNEIHTFFIIELDIIDVLFVPRKDTVEVVSLTKKYEIGMVIIRGNSILLMEPLESMEYVPKTE